MEWALLPFRRYTTFQGRSRRKEFWYFHLFFTLVTLAAGVADIGLGLTSMILGIFGPFTLLTYAIFLSPSLAVSARRLHDLDRTALWLLLGILPIVSLVLIEERAPIAPYVALPGLALLVFFFLDGTRGPNRFGADPKAEKEGAATVA